MKKLENKTKKQKVINYLYSFWYVTRVFMYGGQIGMSICEGRVDLNGPRIALQRSLNILHFFKCVTHVTAAEEKEIYQDRKKKRDKENHKIINYIYLILGYSNFKEGKSSHVYAIITNRFISTIHK